MLKWGLQIRLIRPVSWLKYKWENVNLKCSALSVVKASLHDAMVTIQKGKCDTPQTHCYQSDGGTVTSAQTSDPFHESPVTQRSLSHHSLILTEKDSCFCCCLFRRSFHRQAAAPSWKAERKEIKEFRVPHFWFYLVKYRWDNQCLSQDDYTLCTYRNADKDNLNWVRISTD